MNKYFGIIENRIDKLIQISITERKDKGLGVLFLDFCDEQTLDCRYVAYNSEDFPDDVKQQYSDRINSIPDTIIFLFLYDKNNKTMLEIDLDKNSNFHSIKNHNNNESNNNESNNNESNNNVSNNN